jgi:hypothetical protein
MACVIPLVISRDASDGRARGQSPKRGTESAGDGGHLGDRVREMPTNQHFFLFKARGIIVE